MMSDFRGRHISPSTNSARAWPARLGILVGMVLALGLGGCQGGAPAPAVPTAVVQTAPPDTVLAPSSPAPVMSPAPAILTAVPPSVTVPPTLVARATPAATATPRLVPTAIPTTPATAAAPALPVRLVVDLPGGLLDAPVVEMGWKVVSTASGPRSDWEIPKNEAGHHINSVALGEPGNLVISGHNNIYGQVFRLLSLAWNNDQRTKVDNYTDSSALLKGRPIQLFDAAGRRYDYTIAEFYRLKDTGVPPEQRVANARFMQPTAETRLTLITCWPPSSNTHRLVIIAEPAP